MSKHMSNNRPGTCHLVMIYLPLLLTYRMIYLPFIVNKKTPNDLPPFIVNIL